MESNSQRGVSMDDIRRAEDKRIGQVFSTMLIFTTLMVLAPISTYFLSKSYVFEGYFNVAADSSYIYSAISAIVVVHIILGAFIWTAWKDATSETLKKKTQ